MNCQVHTWKVRLEKKASLLALGWSSVALDLTGSTGSPLRPQTAYANRCSLKSLKGSTRDSPRRVLAGMLEASQHHINQPQREGLGSQHSGGGGSSMRASEPSLTTWEFEASLGDMSSNKANAVG